MDQVSWRAVDAALKLGRIDGIDDARMLAGIPIAADALAQLRWVPWDHYCAVLENIEAACGRERFDELLHGQYHRMLDDAAPYVRALVSPEALYRGVVRFMRPMFPNQRIGCEAAGDGLLRYTVTIVSDARGCATFYRGSHMGFLGIPQLLDLPPATVERATWDDRSLDCVLRLPDSQTVLSRARRTSTAAMRGVATLFDELGGELRHYIHALSSTHRVVRQQSERMVLISRVGQQLSRQTDVDSLAAVLIDCLHRHTACNYVALWTAGRDGGAAALVRESGVRPDADHVRVVPLVGGGNDVGRLEVAAGAGAIDTSFVLDLAPWIAIALENSRMFETIARGHGADAPTSLEPRLSAAATRWSLTPRQIDALRFVAQGHSNKEVAAELGCAENTVELHVTQLLRKSSSNSRAQLIARFWGA